MSFLCEQLGLQRSFLNNVERGRSSMSPERLVKIAQMLQTSVEYLSDETDNPSPEESELHVMSESHAKLYVKTLDTVRQMSDSPEGEEKLQKLLEYAEFLELSYKKK